LAAGETIMSKSEPFGAAATVPAAAVASSSALDTPIATVFRIWENCTSFVLVFLDVPLVWGCGKCALAHLNVPPCMTVAD
jgi:hypothetical protein